MREASNNIQFDLQRAACEFLMPAFTQDGVRYENQTDAKTDSNEI